MSLSDDCILAALNDRGYWTGSLNWANGRRELSRSYDTQEAIVAAAQSYYANLGVTAYDVDKALHAILAKQPPNPAFSHCRILKPWRRTSFPRPPRVS